MRPLKPAQAGLILLGLGLGFWIFFQVLSFVLHHAPEPIGSRADMFASGASQTLLLTLEAGVFGLALGVLIGLAKLSPNWALRGPAEALIWLVRGTPLLVQILFAYFALPALFPWLLLTDFGAAALALSVNVGVYNAEVIRAGILAVPRGQTEAAQSLGLSKFKTFRFIIFPQALRIVIPPLVNNLAALLKDSSLASSIGLLELSLAGNRVSSETFLPVPVLTTVAAVYLALTTALTTVTRFFERRLWASSGGRR
jgi:polar amino acid transport system permease protein